MTNTKRNIGSGEDCPDAGEQKPVLEKIVELFDPEPEQGAAKPPPPVPSA